MTLLKSLILLLVSGLLFVGCQSQASVDYTLLVPTGAPTALVVDMLDKENTSITVVNGVDPLMSEFLNPAQTMDFIIAPIINVSKLQMENKTAYKLVGIMSWGNLVILGQPNTDLNAAKMAVFAPMGVPGVITKHLLEKEGLSPELSNVPTMADAMSLYLGGHVDAVLMAYPLAQNLIDQHGATILMDVQATYEKHTGLSNYPQAGLYVSEAFYHEHKKEVTSMMNQLIETHDKNRLTPERLNQLSDEHKSHLLIDTMAPLVKNYTALGLGPCYSLEKLEDLNQFLALFDLELNASMVVR
ncbi:MAG: ABC transporter substrate-binding protein [Erysipelotrichaceae bacterium]|nr:ABC transporter substrate-binding protein [Erysipelotrichaceae bacterium]MCD8574691.1 ABC transporter substrate-binding protein [Erysipelotrichaceae bacterium]